MPISDCHLVDLPKISDPRGNLSFIEGLNHIPFSINRVYYLYDVPEGEDRGAHAHKQLQQLIVPLSGSFEVCLDDATQQTTYRLANPAQGLYICPMIWRNISQFTSRAVLLTLASDYYNEEDYIRDYQSFLKLALS